MIDLINEEWRNIPEFPNYLISNAGRVYNLKRDRVMRTSLNNFGHVKITLATDWETERFRYTRSVAQLVAEAFVERPNRLCDQVILLDGDLTNVIVSNLAWRPSWFGWKYSHQMKSIQPVHFKNLIVREINTGDEYDSIIHAGTTEGLLFKDIWESTYNGKQIFPYGQTFEVIKRV